MVINNLNPVCVPVYLLIGLFACGTRNWSYSKDMRNQPSVGLATRAVIPARDYCAMSRQTADLIKAEVKSKPDLLFCASAGGSPTGTYKRLSADQAKNARLFRKLRVLQIDEWGGLASEHPATCWSYLQNQLVRPLDIGADRFAGFQSDAADRERECKRIEVWLRKNGPIDICLLGLGLNGHIAMIEPADEFVPHTHVARLARSSLNHGMLQGLKQKPRFGFTLGVADILQSRKILLVVSGEPKRMVLKRLLKGEISTRFPASFLWLHSDVTVLCDRAAYG
jgi:galactosamine-6-phosphate isomerase